MTKTIKKSELIKVVVNLIKEAQLVYNLSQEKQPLKFEKILVKLNKT